MVTMMWNRVSVAALLAVLVACSSAGSDPGDDASASASASPTTTTLAEFVNGAGFTLEEAVIEDPVLALPAARVLLPTGWAFEQQVTWQPAALPLANPQFIASSPDQLTGIQAFGSAFFGWRDDYELDAEGTVDLGVIVKEFESPEDFARSFVAANRAGSTELGVETDPMPSTETSTFVRYRVGYDFDGEAVIEEFVIIHDSVPSVDDRVVWGPILIYSVWAPATGFDDLRNDLHAIALSTKTESLWLANHQIVAASFAANGLLPVTDPSATPGLVSSLDRLSAEQRAQLDLALDSGELVVRELTEWLEVTAMAGI